MSLWLQSADRREHLRLDLLKLLGSFLVTQADALRDAVTLRVTGASTTVSRSGHPRSYIGNGYTVVTPKMGVAPAAVANESGGHAISYQKIGTSAPTGTLGRNS